jgi:hypothetical protein
LTPREIHSSGADCRDKVASDSGPAKVGAEERKGDAAIFRTTTALFLNKELGNGAGKWREMVTLYATLYLTPSYKFIISKRENGGVVFPHLPLGDPDQQLSRRR